MRRSTYCIGTVETPSGKPQIEGMISGKRDKHRGGRRSSTATHTLTPRRTGSYPPSRCVGRWLRSAQLNYLRGERVRGGTAPYVRSPDAGHEARRRGESQPEKPLQRDERQKQWKRSVGPADCWWGRWQVGLRARHGQTCHVACPEKRRRGKRTLIRPATPP